MGSLDEAQQQQLEQLTRALVKKMVHGQIRVLKEGAGAGDAARVRAITDAWDDDA